MNSDVPPVYESYDTNHLFDSVLDQLNLSNDEELGAVLGMAPARIEEIREMRAPVDASLLIRIHELTDISINGLRNILGDRRKDVRFGNWSELDDLE